MRPIAASAATPSLRDEAQTILDEARMVLPGIQALFGFQMVAVFSARFGSVTAPWQAMHFVALALCALAMGLVMTPAAYHRVAERGRVTRSFTELASHLVALGMVPLAMSLALDMTVVAQQLFGRPAVSICAGAIAVVAFCGLWFAWPLASRRAALHRRSA